MASEQLLCSICLDVFNDPVSTPCGHNFCKICLKTHWDNSHPYRCPNCNKQFKQRPDLKINTTLREIVDEYKKKIEVLCDMCTEGKLKAVKSCLVCQTSYCETHLESHLRVSGLRKHKLIDPVKDLQDYICPKHERPLELFCRDDRTCVCLSCTDGDHKNHNTVPMRQSELLDMMAKRHRASEKPDADVTEDLEKEITELKKRNHELEMKAENHDKDVIKHLEQEIAQLESRNHTLEIIEKNQRASETQDKNLIKGLNKGITELKRKHFDLKMKVGTLKALNKNYEDVLKDSNQEITELKKRNIELQKKIEKQKAAEKHDKDVIKCLRKEIYELKRRNHELEVIVDKQRASETQDKCLIKNLKLMMVKQMQMIEEKQYEDQIKNLNEENTDLRRRNLEQVQKISDTENKLHILQEKHQVLSRQKEFLLWFSCGCFFLLVCLGFVLLLTCSAVDTPQPEVDTPQPEVDTPQPEVDLKRIQRYAVEVTLDSYTAHSNLILSDDEKQVKHTDTPVFYLTHFWRFTSYLNVLGKEGFSSGRFYFEVQVKGKTLWTLGVVRESVDRKEAVPMTPVDGYWTVSMRNENEYVARAGPDVSLSLRGKPQKVGVFVDYEEGLVSFYDVESRSHIYSYTDQSFTEKLYPVLSPCLNDKGKNTEPLIITPVSK